MKSMGGKSVLVGIVVMAIITISFYWFCQRDAEDNYGAGVLKVVYSQSLGEVQQMTTSGTQRLAPTWLPIVSSYLQRNYGSVKRVSLESKTHTQPIEESVWRVYAERGSYGLRTGVRLRDQKLAHIEFRFPPSNQWIHVNAIALGSGQ